MYKNDCRVVHETIIKDIVDVLTDIKDIDEIQFELGKNKSFKSIASATSNLTLVFPVVVSSDMDITSAMMISKAIERKCVAMLQMLFSAFTINDAKDAINYISKFHTNMKMTDQMDFDSFVSYVDDFAKKLEEDAPITVSIDRYEAIREDMKRNMDHYLSMDCINEYSINDYKVLPASLAGGKVVIKEAKGRDRNRADGGIDVEDIAQQIANAIIPPNDNDPKDNNTPKNNNGNTSRHGIKGPTTKNTNIIRTYNNNVTTNSTERSYQYKHDDDYARMKNSAEFFNKQVIPSEIKKANELMPTTMLINFVTPGEDGGDAIMTNAVIGVKAKMYPVTSMDIVDRLRAKNKDNNGFNNFIRATT